MRVSRLSICASLGCRGLRGTIEAIKKFYQWSLFFSFASPCALAKTFAVTDFSQRPSLDCAFLTMDVLSAALTWCAQTAATHGLLTLGV